MTSQTASQIEAARKNLREAITILPAIKPAGLNENAWGEITASFEYIKEAIKRLEEAKYLDSFKRNT